MPAWQRKSGQYTYAINTLESWGEVLYIWSLILRNFTQLYIDDIRLIANQVKRSINIYGIK